MFGLIVAAAMMTSFGEKVTPENAWCEYPRPQMVRDGWAPLNGTWDYAIVSNDTEGIVRNVVAGKILVPFPIESTLSGVGRLTAPGEMIEYRRTFPANPVAGRRLILRFDGVDFRAQVFVNGVEAGIPHEGAQTGFSYDVTDLVRKGSNDLLVRVWDPTEGFVNSLGKQSIKPHGCFYTRVSGIWKSVWMESVPDTWIERFNAIPDIDAGKVGFVFEVNGEEPRTEVEVAVKDADGKVVARGKGRGGRRFEIAMPKGFKLWSPEEPNLYRFTARSAAPTVSMATSLCASSRRRRTRTACSGSSSTTSRTLSSARSTRAGGRTVSSLRPRMRRWSSTSRRSRAAATT